MTARDWPRLRARYGDARDVPRLLSRILDTARGRRSDADAWRELHVLVNGDGDVFDSTVAVLEELLDAVARRELQFSHVIGFVEGSSEAFEIEGPVGEQLRRALLGGGPIYLEALSADDAEVRARTAYLLGHLLDLRETSTPALRALIERDDHAAVLAAAIWALGNLQEQLDRALFARYAREAKHALPRAVASAWLASVLERDVDESDTRAIADAIHRKNGALRARMIGAGTEDR